MIFHSKHRTDIKRLSGPVRKYMRQRFMLSDKYLGELRCFEYEGFINERQVLHILIFHPGLARNQHISLRTYADLEQHPEALLYSGYEDDTRGSLYIEDRRPKAYPRIESRQWLKPEWIRYRWDVTGLWKNVTEEAPIGIEKIALENTTAVIPVGIANYTGFQRRDIDTIHTGTDGFIKYAFSA